MVTVTTKKARIVYDEEDVSFEHKKDVFYLNVAGWKPKVTSKMDEVTGEMSSYTVLKVGSSTIKKFCINIRNFNGDTLLSGGEDIETRVVQTIAYGDKKGHFACTKEQFVERLKETHNRILEDICEYKPKTL